MRTSTHGEVMARKRPPEDSVSKNELMAELRRLRDKSREAELERVVHELQVHHEELTLQQTQLIESQRALEEARDRYAELFDFAPIAFVVLDINGIVKEANLATVRLLGRDRSRLVETPFFLYVVPDDRRAVLDHMARCRAGHDRVESELRFEPHVGDAISAQISSAPARSAHGGPSLLFFTTIFDLSERRRHEADRLRAREEQQRLAEEE